MIVKTMKIFVIFNELLISALLHIIWLDSDLSTRPLVFEAVNLDGHSWTLTSSSWKKSISFFTNLKVKRNEVQSAHAESPCTLLPGYLWVVVSSVWLTGHCFVWCGSFDWLWSLTLLWLNGQCFVWSGSSTWSFNTYGRWSAVFGWLVTALCGVVHLIDCGHCFVWCGSLDWLWLLLCVLWFIWLTMVTALCDVHCVDYGHCFAWCGSFDWLWPCFVWSPSRCFCDLRSQSRSLRSSSPKTPLLSLSSSLILHPFQHMNCKYIILYNLKKEQRKKLYVN